MPAEVLVVDDNLNAAQGFARLILAETQLECIAVDDPDDALEQVRKNPIKVAVLDQRMPKKDGTALYKDINSIDPSIRVIMLSGEAAATEVGEAFTLGFVNYLHKGQVAKLSSLVLTYYSDYYVNLIEKNSLKAPIRICSERKFPYVWKTIDYTLQALVILDEEYIPNNEWITVKEIKAGVTEKKIQKIEIEDKIVLERSEVENLSTKFSFPLPLFSKIQAGLSHAITSQHKTQESSGKKEYFEISSEYTLPKEPVDPRELHVISRQYQIAKVYRRMRCIIVRHCNCCGAKQPFPLVISQPTSKIATRQQDFLSNSEMRQIATGIVNYSR